MLRKIIFMGALFAVAGLALAAAPITGAFGIKFGATLDQLDVERSLVNEVVHVVNPPMPLNLLTLYSVETDKKSARVFRIVGQTMANNEAACIEELASLIGVLEEKYGKFTQHGSMFRLKSGDKSITASCSSERGFTERQVYMIKVLYEDLALTQVKDAL